MVVIIIIFNNKFWLCSLFFFPAILAIRRQQGSGHATLKRASHTYQSTHRTRFRNHFPGCKNLKVLLETLIVTTDNYKNLVLSNELIKVKLPPWKIWKADVSSVSPSLERTQNCTNQLPVNFTSWRRAYNTSGSNWTGKQSYRVILKLQWVKKECLTDKKPCFSSVTSLPFFCQNRGLYVLTSFQWISQKSSKLSWSVLQPVAKMLRPSHAKITFHTSNHC